MSLIFLAPQAMTAWSGVQLATSLSGRCAVSEAVSGVLIAHSPCTHDVVRPPLSQSSQPSGMQGEAGAAPPSWYAGREVALLN